MIEQTTPEPGHDELPELHEHTELHEHLPFVHPTRTTYDQEVAEVKDKILRMGSEVEDQIRAAYAGLFTTDGSLADHAAFLEDGTRFQPVIERARLVGGDPSSV